MAARTTSTPPSSMPRVEAIPGCDRHDAGPGEPLDRSRQATRTYVTPELPRSARRARRLPGTDDPQLRPSSATDTAFQTRTYPSKANIRAPCTRGIHRIPRQKHMRGPVDDTARTRAGHTDARFRVGTYSARHQCNLLPRCKAVGTAQTLRPTSNYNWHTDKNLSWLDSRGPDENSSRIPRASTAGLRPQVRGSSPRSRNPPRSRTRDHNSPTLGYQHTRQTRSSRAQSDTGDR